MVDPLGLTGAQQASGLAPALRPQTPADANGPSFKDVLLENLQKVNELQQDATHAIEDLQTGNRDDVEGVLLATQKADMAFRTLVAVRHKFQQAYEEIKQMRV
mgnify:CR=1 FL=1